MVRLYQLNSTKMTPEFFPERRFQALVLNEKTKEMLLGTNQTLR